jgi:hypothetical protein
MIIFLILVPGRGVNIAEYLIRVKGEEGARK